MRAYFEEPNCKTLDRDIENFRRQQKTADDRLTLSLIAEAIADLEAKKASLGPEEKSKAGSKFQASVHFWTFRGRAMR
jgi:hypothetical protein